MARYYFHLRDGVGILIDEEGRQLESLASVANAALIETRSIISADALAGHIRLDQRIDVEDEARKPRLALAESENQARPTTAISGSPCLPSARTCAVTAEKPARSK